MRHSLHKTRVGDSPMPHPPSVAQNRSVLLGETPTSLPWHMSVTIRAGPHHRVCSVLTTHTVCSGQLFLVFLRQNSCPRPHIPPFLLHHWQEVSQHTLALSLYRSTHFFFSLSLPLISLCVSIAPTVHSGLMPFFQRTFRRELGYDEVKSGVEPENYMDVCSVFRGHCFRCSQSLFPQTWQN